MALLSTQVLPDNTLEEFRIEFNKLVTDVSGLSLGNTFDTQIIFEGTTDDTFETALSVTDPTADRSIVFPNASGNVLLDSTNIALADSIEIQFGDGTDLKIFHDGSNSIIRDNGTGSLFLEGDVVAIRNAASDETMAQFTQDGAATLYHNNVAILATAATGISVTGDVVATDDLILDSDSAVIQLGDDQDVTLTHVHNTGVLLNAAMVVQFRDSAINIGSPADGDLDINADDEIELNSTLVDVNANLDVSGTYTGGGLMTTGGNIVIPNDGNIGSVGDTDAIAISSSGVVTFSQTPVFSGDSTFSDDISLTSDGAIINFGANSEVTLTHVHDKGLALKHTATADDKPVVLILQTGETDIAANDVLGGIDFMAPDEATGTDAVLTAAGIAAVSEGDFSSSNNATKLSFKTAASEAASEKMSLSSAGVLDVDGGITVDNITIDGTEIDLSSGDLTLDVAGSIVLNADSGSINLADDSTTFAELINSSSDFVVKSSQNDKDIIFKGVDNSSLITALTLDMSAAGNAIFNNDVTVGNDINLLSDGAVIYFGANKDVQAFHVHNSGLTLRNNSTGDDTPFLLTLQTGETDIAASDVLGKIQFQAPDEGTGTDAILIAAAIQAVSEGDFSSSSNATRLEFMTGASEAAATKMTLTSAGDVGIGTTTPADELSVAGDMRIQQAGGRIVQLNSSGAYSLGSSGGSAIRFVEESGSHHLDFETHHTGNSHAARMRIDKEGDVSLLTDIVALKFGLDEEVSLNHIHNTGLHLIGTTATNSYTEFKMTDGNAGYAWQVRSDAAQSISTGSFVLNDVDSSTFPIVINEGNATNTLKLSGGNVSIAGNFLQQKAGNTELMTENTTTASVKGGFQALSNQSIRVGSITDFPTELVVNNVVVLTADTSDNIHVANILTAGTTDTSPYNNTGNNRGLALISNPGIISASRDGGDALAINRTGSDGAVAVWYREGTAVGNISVNGTNAAYNTSSDYRLKENISYTWDATTRLKQLKPARFNFTDTPDTTVDGFLAHEVSSIVPEAIQGTKDEVETTNILLEDPKDWLGKDFLLLDRTAANGANNGGKIFNHDPVYQQIDQMKLVPLLVKTIMELEARVAALES